MDDLSIDRSAQYALKNGPIRSYDECFQRDSNMAWLRRQASIEFYKVLESIVANQDAKVTRDIEHGGEGG